jgi:hypothetical protein
MWVTLGNICNCRRQHTAVSKLVTFKVFRNITDFHCTHESGVSVPTIQITVAFTHLPLVILPRLFHAGFVNTILYYLSSLLSAFYALLDLIKDVGSLWRVQIIHFLIIQFSLTSCFILFSNIPDTHSFINVKIKFHPPKTVSNAIPL